MISQTATDTLSRQPQRPTPGLMMLHSNRMESLRELLLSWLQAQPLAVLDEDYLLVQSNGIAQWLKQALAEDDQQGPGIAAAMKIMLPARFIWQQAYRQLMPELPRVSAFDKEPLTWRLLSLLQQGDLWQLPELAPLADYWQQSQGQHPAQGLLLAQQLADLFDQYQQYRADWLTHWQDGRWQYSQGQQAQALPSDQRWQAKLWQLLHQAIADDGSLTPEAKISRADVHRLFLQRVQTLSAQDAQRLPPRVLVFGLSSLAQQSLEVLQALGKHCQVMLFVHNPSPHYWGDLLPDREQLSQWLREYRRHSSGGQPQLPQLGQPLLASWGRQGRDYLRLLDQMDERSSYEPLLQHHRLQIDLFEPSPGTHLLAQLQQDIFHLQHLSAQGTRQVAGDDRSLTFTLCHSVQREVEVLHNQLLRELAQAQQQGQTLHPRDILVMVPRIEDYSASVRAVFNGYERHDPRYLPFHLCDQGLSEQDPLIRAALFLLRLPEQRLTSLELADLWQLPSIRARFGLSDDLWPALAQWIDAAGVRWGLDPAHKAQMGLPPEAQNTWLFGLRRMLLGYALGDGEHWQDIAPLPEVGGLAAEAVGALADMLQRLQHWLPLLQQAYHLDEWLALLMQLWQDFFSPSSEQEQQLLSQMQTLLVDWQAQLTHSQRLQPLALAVVGQQVEQLLQRPSFQQSFVSGAINVATLMPMRALPFKQIWLLGMNEHDYPRQSQSNDFDLMQYDYRPGDRSRREDDRYLFLEAMLSARDKLSISWVGRNIRDNSELPPSVLVAQLRDHLARGWQGEDQPLLAQLTLEQPMQPFSARYRQPQRHPEMVSYAKEWFAQQPNMTSQPPRREPPSGPHNLSLLKSFLDSPMMAYFEQGLGISRVQEANSLSEQEALMLSGLDNWSLQQPLIERCQNAPDWPSLSQELTQWVKQLQRQGRIAPGALGELQTQALSRGAQALQQALAEFAKRYPVAVAPARLGQHAVGSVLWQDSLPTLWQGDEQRAQLLVWPSTLFQAKKSGSGARKWKHCLLPYLRHLLANCQTACDTQVLSLNGNLLFRALPTDEARQRLQHLSQAWQANLEQPWHSELALATLTTTGAPASDSKIAEYWQLRLQAEPRLSLLFADAAALLASDWEAHGHSLYDEFIAACQSSNPKGKTDEQS